MTYAPLPTVEAGETPREEFLVFSNRVGIVPGASRLDDDGQNGTRSEDDGADTIEVPGSHSLALADNDDTHKMPLVSLSALSETGKPLPASTGSTAFVQVVAPATLPEGYELETEVVSFMGQQRQTIKVKVPVGGVEQGQSFFAPITIVGSVTPDVRTLDTGAVRDHRVEIPTARWVTDSMMYSNMVSVTAMW
jgi:hypothetical protein